MFYELVLRNSRRSRRENGLFFASLLISIIAFYIILSLSQQDVMLFLKQMESNAVDKLLAIIPVFYGLTLVILFFLIYYASKFQLERRRHEFGMYLMLGMRRMRLFAMLLAEDMRSSLLSLLIGLPSAILLSELISLVTARVVGLGIIEHRFSLSLNAVLLTAAGFLLIKLAACLILSGRISRQEIGSLLVDTPEGTRRQLPAAVYTLALISGLLCLAAAYFMAIIGLSWQQARKMALTLALGFFGTLLLFFGLRAAMALLIKTGRRDTGLRVFNFRQLQENVIHRSSTMAVSSILILAALCCFGAGVAVANSYGKAEPHILDYTFEDYSCENAADGAAKIRDTLAAHGLDGKFAALFDMKIGSIRTTEDYDNAFKMASVMDALAALPQSAARDTLLNNLGIGGVSYPHIIALSSYNELLRLGGLPELELAPDEAGVYMDSEFADAEKLGILNAILEKKPEASIDGAPIYLTGTVQSASVVTDRSITLSFALILPDESFEYYSQGLNDVYVNGVLKSDVVEKSGLMNEISAENERLDETGLEYESYLKNMGRALFYTVAASYITIYLAIIFLIIANTVIGAQFLMGQQKTSRRYRTLVRLGASYETLCGSAKKQINWFFGIPTVVAAVSSLFAVRALLSGILPPDTQGNISGMMPVSGAMILLLCVIEYIYIAAVRRSSSRYLLTLMAPEREE